MATQQLIPKEKSKKPISREKSKVIDIGLVFCTIKVDLSEESSRELLYQDLKAAKTDRSGFLNFIVKCMVVLLSTVGCTVCIALLLVIPVSMIVISLAYFDQCPLQRFIPIYLLVSGIVSVIKQISSLIQRFINSLRERDQENIRSNPFDGIVGCFLFMWFIAGNIWIYGSFSAWDRYDPGSANYCHPTLYLFAFWIVTSTYIILMIMVMCGCCFVCCLLLITVMSGGSKH